MTKKNQKVTGLASSLEALQGVSLSVLGERGAYSTPGGLILVHHQSQKHDTPFRFQALLIAGVGRGKLIVDSL